MKERQEVTAAQCSAAEMKTFLAPRRCSGKFATGRPGQMAPARQPNGSPIF